MKFLHDNQELIVLYLVLAGLLVMAIAFAPATRIGNEWAFAHHSVREVLAAIVRGK